MENASKSLHPLILAAAGSVTIASLAAAAHFTGLIPTRSSEPPPAPAAEQAAPAVTPPAAAQPAPAPVARAEAPAPEPSRPAAKPRAQHRHSEPSHPAQPAQARNAGDDWRYDGGTRRVANNDAGIDVIPSTPTPAAATQAPPVCRECGTVESVNEVSVKGEGSGVGAIAGGVLGGVLGNQVGRGKGKDLATIAGAVGGAFAGHTVEKNVRSEKQYKVTVRFDDGLVQTYTQGGNTAWHTGERVRLANGSLVPI